MAANSINQALAEAWGRRDGHTAREPITIRAKTLRDVQYLFIIFRKMYSHQTETTCSSQNSETTSDSSYFPKTAENHSELSVRKFH